MAINPVRDDLVIPLGQNHNIRLNFFQDPLNTEPADMSGKNVRLMIKKNNSDTNSESIIDRVQPIVGSSCVFALTPGDTHDIGEGESWYDVWLQADAGGVYSQALAYGSITIEKLTNS